MQLLCKAELREQTVQCTFKHTFSHFIRLTVSVEGVIMRRIAPILSAPDIFIPAIQTILIALDSGQHEISLKIRPL